MTVSEQLAAAVAELAVMGVRAVATAKDGRWGVLIQETHYTADAEILADDDERSDWVAIVAADAKGVRA